MKPVCFSLPTGSSHLHVTLSACTAIMSSVLIVTPSPPTWLCILAAPVLFKEELKDMEKEEGDTIALCCVLAKPDASVTWKKGTSVLRAGGKYEMKQEGCVAEMVIHDAEPEDAGRYFCITGEQQTTAQVKIHGRVKGGVFTSSLSLLPDFLNLPLSLELSAC